MLHYRVGYAAAILATCVGTGHAIERVTIGDFRIDQTEVTIGAFRSHLKGQVTKAEREGGGFEYSAGWTRRKGWTWEKPYGTEGKESEPVVHVTWKEASDFCKNAGGRLPRFEEWKRAAYSEQRASPSDGFIKGQTYRYPVGNEPQGMNNSRRRHFPVGTTKRGVNGLYDMGANVWEWLADRRGDDALTAGGSWWYGSEMTRVAGAQWKPANFYAVYIGFRCVYDVKRR